MAPMTFNHCSMAARKKGEGDRTRRRRWLALVNEDPDLTSSEKCALIALALISNDALSPRHASRQWVADRADVSKRTVSRAVAKAVKLEYLKVYPQRNDQMPDWFNAEGRSRCIQGLSLYYFCIPNQGQSRRSDGVQSDGVPNQNGQSRRSDGVPSSNSHGVPDLKTGYKCWSHGVPR